MTLFFAVYTPFLMFALFLLFSAKEAGKRKREAQARRIAEYRKSPASRILILND